ncbi:MAG: hypothetical protein Barrevirus9_10 [Barrevirus sp.]|uniref:Uncharacterized protein n=1 Tax=Barrevirus sp. TaxID=2487763 RepID=A0A3G4ZSR3_9VIRU|nr:MAG: hypothetical protein Barrevirus9_10 [Barrevirus sp.]
MSLKKQLLDPLGTLCKIVALNFSEIHTKISIHDHVLSLHKPDNYQSLIRMINGDSKENVSELFYAIMRIIKWYLYKPANQGEIVKEESVEEVDEDSPFSSPKYNESNEEKINKINKQKEKKEEDDYENWIAICESNEIKRLVTYACNALRKLQETYEYGNVILAVQFYINILEDAVLGKFNDKKLPKYITKKEREFENLLDYDKLKNFWDLKKLKRICDLYDSVFSVYEDDEMPGPEKAALVDGYMRSINSILKLTDADFQKLIQNSSKG